MIVGIVGSEGAKFTDNGRGDARELIRRILTDGAVTELVSGACHLGGIDIWAAEIARELGLKVTEFAPKTHSWEDGYKPRNLKIAGVSDVVHCITVNRVPSNFQGMQFAKCYHCGTDAHVKSGGCWTAKQTQQAGKRAEWHVINQ